MRVRSLMSETILTSRMVRAMRKKLEVHSDKGHWNTCTIEYLMKRLGEEFQELAEAIDSGVTPDEVWAEAGDVANFAAMIADNYEAAK